MAFLIGYSIWHLIGAITLIWDEFYNWTYKPSKYERFLHVAFLCILPIGLLAFIMLYFMHNEPVLQGISKPGNFFKNS